LFFWHFPMEGDCRLAFSDRVRGEVSGRVQMNLLLTI
jgi:hypothetical protein